VVLPAFAAARVLTAVAMVASVTQRSGVVTWSQLRDAFVHWDAVSYLDIAGHAYPATLDYHDAFLPGYPLLVRAASVATGDLVVAGLLVSAVAELAALFVIHELVRRERDDRVAVFAVWAIALAPLGFFFAGAYTESAFIAGTALSLLLMRSGNLRGASLAGAFAVAMRLTGVVLVVVIAAEMMARHRLRRDVLWLAIIPLPLLLYAAYLHIRTGDALAFLHAQSLPSFGEAAAWPWDGLRTTWATAAASTDPTNRAVFVREIVAGLAGFVAVVAAWLDAHFPRSLALYCTLVWLMAVSLTFWRSVPRYDLALFPIAIVIADLTRRAGVLRPLLVGAGALVLAWGAYVFAEGGWIG
jgi:Mannosyltransferase (PIG-V)